MDQETFAVRVEAIKARLYRTAYLYLGSESAALDAVDEAVYQALRALKKLREWCLDSMAWKLRRARHMVDRAISLVPMH